MASIVESVYATRKTRKGAEALVARDARWLAEGIDFVAPEQVPGAYDVTLPWVRVSETTLSVRKADDGTFQVVQRTLVLASA